MKKCGFLFVLLCSLWVIAFNPTPVQAATAGEYNATAKRLLENYYYPGLYIGTGLWNIQNAYSAEEYANQDQLDAIYSVADDIALNYPEDSDRIRAVHDWIITNIEYSEDQGDYNGYPYHDLANPFTVFLNRRGVCYGFANLTQLMLQHMCIPCVVVRGSGNGMSHVWNAVYVNDSWVFTDNTFDDGYSTEDTISYEHHLMSDEVYNNRYVTFYLESWQGDVCYYPVCVSPDSTYHEIILKTNGSACVEKIPFCESSTSTLLPVPEREEEVFSCWRGDQGQSAKYYENLGGCLVNLEKATEDITFTAKYKTHDDYKSLIPKGLHAYVGDKLEDVALPDRFTWADGSRVLNTECFHSAPAIYTPENSDVYDIVENIYITVNVEERPVPAIKTHSLSLGGLIGVNFYLELPQLDGVDYSKSFMEFTVNGVTSKDSFDATCMDENNKGYYGFTCYVSSIQMAEEISAVFYYGDGLTVSEEYSVEDYIKEFQEIEESYDSCTIELVHSIADYGHYIQLYLDDVRDWTLGEGYQAMSTYFTKSEDLNQTVSGFDYTCNPGESEVEKISFSLNLDSAVSMYVYIKMTDGYEGQVSAVMDESTVDITKEKDGRYLVKSGGIPAHELGKLREFIVTTESGSAKLSLSAMTYAQISLGKEDITENEKNGIRSFVKYYNAAKAYFEEKGAA